MSRVNASLVSMIERETYDVLVIGAGLSGLMFAYSAARTTPGLRILVVDAGPKGALRHVDDRRDNHFGFRQWTGLDHDPFLHADEADREGWHGAPRRVLGGRGLYWHGVLCRIDPSEFRGDPDALGWLARIGLGPEGQSYDALSRLLSNLDCMKNGDIPLLAGNAELPFRTAARAFDTRHSSPFNPLTLFDFGSTGCGAVGIAVGTMATGLGRADPFWKADLKRGPEALSVHAKSVVLAAGVVQNCLLAETALRTNAKYTFTDHLDVGLACFIPANAQSYALFAKSFYERYIWSRSSVEGFNLFLTFLEREGGLVAVCWATGEKDLNEPVICDPGRKPLVKARKSRSDMEKEARMKRVARQTLDETLEKVGDGGRLRIIANGCETKLAIKIMKFHDVPAWSCIDYTSNLGSTDHEACLSSASLGFPSDEGEIEDGLFLAGPCALHRMGSANPNFAALAMALSLGQKISCA